MCIKHPYYGDYAVPRPERVLEVPAHGEIPMGTRVRALRWQRGMTAEELGIAAGMTQGGPFDRSHVSHVETGRVQPSQAFLAGAASALGISVDDLLGASRAAVLSWMASGPPGTTQTQRPPSGRRGRRTSTEAEQPSASLDAPSTAEEGDAGASIAGLDVDVTPFLIALAQLPPPLQARCLRALLPLVEAFRDIAAENQ